MKSLKKININIITLTISLIFINIFALKAQEIEINSTDLYIKSKDNNGFLKFYSTGELLLNKPTTNTATAFTINVNDNAYSAITVRKNWASPASFIVYGNGTAYLLNTAITSDSTLKKDITPLKSQIENIKKLKGVSYKWKNKSLQGDKKSFGLLAQELEKIYPDMVFTTDSGVKGIFYDELIPVLLSAVQEQQETIERLSARIENIEYDCCNKDDKSKSASINDPEVNSVDKTILYQNAPNPFSVQTNIGFEIPESVQSAQLHICNMVGTLLKSIPINQRGNASITINANEFSAGMYLYSLVCDGKIVDTKQMLLTD